MTRQEHHLLRSCPCRECEEERARRDHAKQSHLHSISVDAALVLGFIDSRCPEGSLAAQIAAREGPREAPQEPLRGPEGEGDKV